MLQIISAVIRDSEDKTNISLLFANQVWVIFILSSYNLCFFDRKSQRSAQKFGFCC